MKNKSVRKCKKWHCETSVHGHCIVRPDKSGQVRPGMKYYFSSTVSPTLFKFGPPPKPECSFLTVPRSELYDPPKLWNQRFVTLQLA